MPIGIRQEAEQELINAALLVAEDLRKAEGCSGNHYASIQLAADKYYMSFPCPNSRKGYMPEDKVEVPLVVRRHIVLKFLGEPAVAADILHALVYNSTCNCWHFTYAGMFYGIEPDGYIHT